MKINLNSTNDEICRIDKCAVSFDSNGANSLKIQKWKIWESIKITKIDTKIPEITWIVPFIEFINGASINAKSDYEQLIKGN